MALLKQCSRCDRLVPHGVTLCAECEGKDAWARNHGPLRAVYGDPRWPKVKRFVLERDGRRCVHCGRGDLLCVSHRGDTMTLMRQGADLFDPALLVLECKRCAPAAAVARRAQRPMFQ